MPRFSAGSALKRRSRAPERSVRRSAGGARLRAPQPGLPRARPPAGSTDPADAPRGARRRYWPAELIDRAGPACVAVKPQLACFERHGAPGLGGPDRGRREGAAGGPARRRRRQARRRPDTTAYGQALLRRDAGQRARSRRLHDQPAARRRRDRALRRRRRERRLRRLLAGPDLEPRRGRAPGRRRPAPLRERLAGLVAERAPRLTGESGLSGMGAVVGATDAGAARRGCAS